MIFARSPLRAEHYSGAARIALRQACEFRDHSLARGPYLDRRVDRALMREFALEYRKYTARAREALCPHPLFPLIG